MLVFGEYLLVSKALHLASLDKHNFAKGKFAPVNSVVLMLSYPVECPGTENVRVKTSTVDVLSVGK